MPLRPLIGDMERIIIVMKLTDYKKVIFVGDKVPSKDNVPYQS